jgi:hypothetical protein
MKFNRNVVFEVRINAHDKFKLQRKDPVKPAKESKAKSTKKSKKGKNAKKVEEAPEEAPAAAPTEVAENTSDSPKTHSTVDARIESMKKYVDSWTRFSDRIVITADYSLGAQGNDEDVNIYVKKIEKTLE